MNSFGDNRCPACNAIVLSGNLEKVCACCGAAFESLSPDSSADEKGEATIRGDEQPTQGMDSVTGPSAKKSESTIGAYRLIKIIGQGGMGTVHLAEQTTPVLRRVALKVIRPGFDNVEIVHRFEAERQALALMEHPNIAKLFDAGKTPEGLPFFAMEWVDGEPVTNFCRVNKLELSERIELFLAICRGVSHAHQKGIIHRDIKPSNVLVIQIDGKPIPKIIDFGIAKALDGELSGNVLQTVAGQILGTPQYMSPEQANYDSMAEVDTRSDVYSLGALFYELLCGQSPLDIEVLNRAGLEEVLRVLREVDPIKPSERVTTFFSGKQSEPSDEQKTEAYRESQNLKGDLDWITMKALSKDRERRYSTVNAFAEDIGRYIRNEPVEAGPPSALYRFGKFSKRNRSLLVTSFSVLAVLLLSLIVSNYQRARAEQERARAEELLRKASESDRVLANQFFKEGDPARAAVYLSRAQRFDPTNRSAAADHLRLITHLRGSEFGRLRSSGRLVGGYLDRLVYSPDGNTLAAYDGERNQVRVWGFPGFQLSGPSITVSETLRSLALTADKRLVVDSKELLQVFDSESGELISEFKTDSNNSGEASYKTDSSRAMVHYYGYENSRKFEEAQFYDFSGNPKLIHQERYSGDVVFAFSPEGSLFATRLSSDYVKFQRLPGGETVGTPRKVPAWAINLSFSAGGDYLLLQGSISDRKDRVVLLSIKDSKYHELVHEEPVAEARFNKSGSHLLTETTSNQGRIWECASGELSGERFDLGEVEDLIFEETFVAAVSDGQARYWSLKGDAGELRINLTHEVNQDKLMNRSGKVVKAALSEDHYLMAASYSGNVRIFPVVDFPEPIGGSFRHPGLMTMRFSPDRKSLVTFGRDGTWAMWEVANGRAIPGLAGPGAVKYRTMNETLSQDRKLLAISGRGAIAEVYDLGSGKLVAGPLRHGETIEALGFSSDGKWLATGSRDHTARVWDVSTGEPVTAPLQHVGQVRDVRFGRGDRILIANADNRLIAFDIDTSKIISPTFAGGRWASSFDFSPDQQLYLAAFEEVVELWNAKEHRLIGRLEHEKVRYAGFSQSGHTIYTLSSIIPNFQENSDIESAQKDENASHVPVLRFWDSGKAKPVGVKIILEGFGGNCFVLKSSVHDRILVIDSDTGRVRVVSAGESEPVFDDFIFGKLSDWKGVEISVDGKFLKYRTAPAARSRRVDERIVDLGSGDIVKGCDSHFPEDLDQLSSTKEWKVMDSGGLRAVNDHFESDQSISFPGIEDMGIYRLGFCDNDSSILYSTMSQSTNVFIKHSTLIPEGPAPPWFRDSLSQLASGSHGTDTGEVRWLSFEELGELRRQLNQVPPGNTIYHEVKDWFLEAFTKERAVYPGARQTVGQYIEQCDESQIFFHEIRGMGLGR